MTDLLTTPFLITCAKFLFAFVPLAFLPLLITGERRGASLIQDRLGPNRAAIVSILGSKGSVNLKSVRFLNHIYQISFLLELYYLLVFSKRQAV